MAPHAPSKMSLTAVPLEVCREIFHRLISDLGLYQTVRLRCVSKLFNQEILHALFTAQVFNLYEHERAKNMSQAMVIEYLVTRAQIDTATNPFLSATCLVARAVGTDKTQHKQIDYVREMFTSMTAHLGSEVMLKKLKKAEEPSFSTPSKHPDAYHREELAIAVTLGETERVKSLLKIGADANWGGHFGAPIAIAARTGQYEVARLLLKRGADLNCQACCRGHYWLCLPGHVWRKEPFALRAAVLADNQQVARLFLKEKYHGITSGTEYEEVIYCAARGGQEDLVWLLINKGTQFSYLGHVKARVMLEGAGAGRVGIVRMMLDHGVDVGVRVSSDNALHRSAWGGHLQVVQLLVECGAKLNTSCDKSSKINTALALAACNGHLEIVQLLLSKGAFVDTDTWNACLSITAQEGHLAMVKFLCSGNRADLSEKMPLPGDSWVELGLDALIRACMRSNYDVVRYLVKEKGVNPNGFDDPVPGQRPSSPMMIALKLGNEKLVALLLALGASRIDPTQSCESYDFATGKFPLQKFNWAVRRDLGMDHADWE